MSGESSNNSARNQEYLQLELARVDHWLKQGEASASNELHENQQRLQEFASDSAASIPRLQRIHRIYGLNRQDADLLLCCIAPSLEERFVHAFAAFTEDKKPDVTPAVLKRLFPESDSLKAFLFQSNPLFDSELLFYDPYPTYLHSLMTRPIRVARRLLNYIQGDESIAEDLRDFLSREDEWAGDSQSIASELHQKIQSLARHIEKAEHSTLLFLRGADGTGKLNLARMVCAQSNLPLLNLDYRFLPENLDGLRKATRLIIRELKLLGAAVVIPDWHEMSEQMGRNAEFLLSKLQEESLLVILTSEKTFRLSRKRFPIIELPVEESNHTERLDIWESSLNGSAPADSKVTPKSLSGLYKFNEGQIKNIVRRSKLQKQALNNGDDTLSGEDLVAACREESSQKLAELAVKVNARHSWDFLILPEDQKDQLRELCNHMRFKAQVYETWDYNTRVSAAGLNALFTGPPGTGKTLAASIIAHELGLDLYKIDLSTVVSKYIGETEKNLSVIFREAEASNAILFFDEADSLFGKRSAVQDAHDRYANIQVGYLLQQMEEFPGMTILATNLVENIDEAFARRLHFSIDFPFPGPVEREQIWRMSFPDAAPVQDNIDFARLGQRVKVPGGNIRNIALHAAFYAAAEDTEISAAHIVRAMEREYEKEGRSLNS